MKGRHTHTHKINKYFFASSHLVLITNFMYSSNSVTTFLVFDVSSRSDSEEQEEDSGTDSSADAPKAKKQRRHLPSLSITGGLDWQFGSYQTILGSDGGEEEGEEEEAKVFYVCVYAGTPT